jgi:hypothetical protein
VNDCGALRKAWKIAAISSNSRFIREIPVYFFSGNVQHCDVWVISGSDLPSRWIAPSTGNGRVVGDDAVDDLLAQAEITNDHKSGWVYDSNYGAETGGTLLWRTLKP